MTAYGLIYYFINLSGFRLWLQKATVIRENSVLMIKENKNNNLAAKCAYLGLMIALALVFGYVESMIPINFGVPGVKLGLANIVTVLCLYIWDWKHAAFVSFTRVTLSGFLFGNLFGVVYGLSGAVLSLLIMIVFKRFFSMITVSAVGGIFHNMGQLLMAYIIVSDLNIFNYLPVLLLAGLVTGSAVGVLCYAVYSRIKLHIL